MQIVRLTINNFRGVQDGELYFSGDTALVGDNNTGKSTVLEAIDLVLGPERLRRFPPIDEHDFWCGQYTAAEDGASPPEIKIEVVIADLSKEQLRHFREHLEWWDEEAKELIDGPPEDTDADGVVPALRVRFNGMYDLEEDDFIGQTYFCWPEPLEEREPDKFYTSDKRRCGFLLLRTLRTGSRALSLERGSLLDIILKLQEKRPQMWEDVLQQARDVTVAEAEELGISETLTQVQNAIRNIVPSEWGENPKMKISDLTREILRKTLTVFMSTGIKDSNGADVLVPFRKQGTGTVNTLVLALLKMIAELKEEVIFAMEEPEIAIPPYTQKRIIHSVRSSAAQAIFSSHSPYVLEEFEPDEILVLQRHQGQLSGKKATLTPSVANAGRYRIEFRRALCEALLSRRVLLTEGKTEFDAISLVARKLGVLQPAEFRSLEELGLAVVDVEGDRSLEPFANYFRGLGKTVFAVYDEQPEPHKTRIRAALDHAFESDKHSFEDVIIDGVPGAILQEFALDLVANGEWPTHIPAVSRPDATKTIQENLACLRIFLDDKKGKGACAAILDKCSPDDMPEYITNTLREIKRVTDPEEEVAEADVGEPAQEGETTEDAPKAEGSA